MSDNVKVMAKKEVLADGPLHPADQKEGPCIFCEAPGRISVEFAGDMPGRIFCCDDHKELLLANDVYIKMPKESISISKVRVYVDGEYLGEVDPGKIE